MNVETARKVAFDLKSEIVSGMIYPIRVQEATTVRELCLEHVERFRAEWNPPQAERYIQKFVLPTFTDVPPGQVTPTPRNTRYTLQPRSH